MSSPASTPARNDSSFDALLPADMALKAAEIGVRKFQIDWLTTFVLAVLAGAFISLGAIFATTVLAGSDAVPFGIARLLAGLVFSLGLILVVAGGAELFTGNNLMVMAWAGRRIGTLQLLQHWGIVYLGNWVGAVATAVLVFLSGHHLFGQGQIGVTAIEIARAKLQFLPLQAFVLGMLGNALVCMAVWLSYSARNTTDKILAVVPPITAFVAAGFEHSVANMYFIPIGLLIKQGASPEFWQLAGLSPSAFADLTWSGFFLHNLLPVTLGNIVGGTLMVGGVYWFIYLRPRSS